MLLLNKQEKTESPIYIPIANKAYTFELRTDTKEGVMKNGEDLILDENKNPVLLRVYNIGSSELYGWIPGTDYPRRYKKILFIPLTAHELINFDKPVVASTYVHSDSITNYDKAVRLSRLHSIDTRISATKISFDRVDKVVKDEMNRNKKVTLKPAVYSFVDLTEEEKPIVEAFLQLYDNDPNVVKQLEELLYYTSGFDMIRLMDDGQDNRRINEYRNRFQETNPNHKGNLESGTQFALPAVKGEIIEGDEPGF
ncbi:MAG: hypothetical protein AAGJ08_00180 [Cyanobacteria bacterium P01_H01_bin.35]